MLPLAAAPVSSSSSFIVRRARLAPLILRRPTPAIVRTMAAAGDADARPPPRQQQQRDNPPNNNTTPAAAAADRARRRTRYKNNWQRRSADELAPQVVMKTPFPAANGRVAIVGGGVAGLVCARELASLGIRSVVFDTGERGPGGRLATRTTADGSFLSGAAVGAAGGKEASPPPPLLAFDHAAQFFTADAANSPEFAELARAWLRRGWVREWDAERVVRLGGGDSGGASSPSALPRPPYFIPATTGGFRALAAALAQDAESTGLVELRCGAWVSRVTADAQSGQWRLAVRKASNGAGGGGGGNEKKSSSAPPCAADPSGDADDPLSFDAVVIAHNGKCANRLAAPMGSPLVAQQLMRLRLSAAWVAMLAFEKGLGLPFEGAFVDGGPALAWAANNTAKLGLAGSGGDNQSATPECWTLVSTDAYAQRRKVPQERIPADVARAVTAELSESFARAAGLGGGDGGDGKLQPLASRVQLWGAALPLNSPGVACVLDPAARVGICGDWLLGAGVQAAATSGLALARRLAALRGVGMEDCVAALKDKEDKVAVGLRAPFAPLGSRTGPCGEFPSSSKEGAGVEVGVAKRAAPPMLAAPVARR